MIILGKNGRRARFQFVFGEPTRGAHQHKSSLLKSWRGIRLQRPRWKTSKDQRPRPLILQPWKVQDGDRKIPESLSNLTWIENHLTPAWLLRAKGSKILGRFHLQIIWAWLVKKGSLKSWSSEKYFDWLPWNLKWRTHNYSEMAACTFCSEKYYQRNFTVDPKQFHG